jgi:hypothetical protein
LVGELLGLDDEVAHNPHARSHLAAYAIGLSTPDGADPHIEGGFNGRSERSILALAFASAGRCLPAALLPVPAPRGRWRADLQAPSCGVEPIASTPSRDFEDADEPYV